MDNKKIGELIAKLRKEKGLTQQELGDKVGVGSRAVSKWECGTTIPDISIINELSETLGITSHELLAGKLKTKIDTNNNRKANNNKLKIFLIIFPIIIFGLTTLLIYFNNKTYTYIIAAENHEKYRVGGYITYKNKELKIYINQFKLNGDEFIDMKIKDYNYNIVLNNKYIFSYGQTKEDVEAYGFYNVFDIEESIQNNYIEKTKISKKELIKNNPHILLTIIDNKNNSHFYDIEISLYKNKNK